MKRSEWTTSTNDDAAARRAGGRTRYNRQRQADAYLRQLDVITLLREGLTQAEIARRLGVHRSTIGRDVRVLGGRRMQTGICPVCRHRIK